MEKSTKTIAEIEVTPIKQGNGFGFRIPKALLDCKVIDPAKKYKAIIMFDDTQGLKHNLDILLSSFSLNSYIATISQEV